MTFTRPKEFRFNFGGLNTNDPADALAPDQYTLAVNVRGVQGKSIRVRPGYKMLFGTAGTSPSSSISRSPSSSPSASISPSASASPSSPSGGAFYIRMNFSYGVNLPAEAVYATVGLYRDSGHTDPIDVVVTRSAGVNQLEYWLHEISLADGETCYLCHYYIRNDSSEWWSSPPDVVRVGSDANFFHGYLPDPPLPGYNYQVVCDLAKNVYYYGTAYGDLGKVALQVGLYSESGGVYTLIANSLQSGPSWDGVELDPTDFPGAAYPGKQYYLGVLFDGDLDVTYLPYTSFQSSPVMTRWSGVLGGADCWKVFLDSDPQNYVSW